MMPTVISPTTHLPNPCIKEEDRHYQGAGLLLPCLPSFGVRRGGTVVIIAYLASYVSVLSHRGQSGGDKGTGRGSVRDPVRDFLSTHP